MQKLRSSGLLNQSFIIAGRMSCSGLAKTLKSSLGKHLVPAIPAFRDAMVAYIKDFDPQILQHVRLSSPEFPF